MATATLTPPPALPYQPPGAVGVVRAVEDLLRASSRPDLRRLTVAATADEIVLSGVVSTFYLKQLAQELVRDIAAGRRLTNRIEVGRN